MIINGIFSLAIMSAILYIKDMPLFTANEPIYTASDL